MGRVPRAAELRGLFKLSIVSPPGDDPPDPPTNVLVLLHGLGDKRKPFTEMGLALKLAETVCLAVQGPQKMPLDFDGFHWGDDISFDSNEEKINPDAGFVTTTKVLHTLVNDVLMNKCGFAPRDIYFLGHGQGAMAALNFVVAQDSKLHKSRAGEGLTIAAEFGGIISYGGGLPSEAPASQKPKNRTPVLVCAGREESEITQQTEEKLRHNFETVRIERIRRVGDHPPKNNSEAMPLMKFLGPRMRSMKGVPKGAVAVN